MKWVSRSWQSCFKQTRLTITVRVIWIESFLKLYVPFNYKPKYHFNGIHSGWTFFRNSHSEVFLGKDVLKICSKFTREHPCRSVISIKLLCNFIEITLWHGCSPVNLLHIFKTPFLKNTSERLLLLFGTAHGWGGLKTLCLKSVIHVLWWSDLAESYLT